MHQGTRDTYNQSAGSLSEHYDQIGPRSGDVDLAFSLAGNPGSAVVLELGCANGRDARAIIRHTPHYTGIDSSEKMIALARQKVPKGIFEVADAINYDYPKETFDIVFAFALFRHLDLSEVTTVLKKVAGSLKPGGVLYISSNYADVYKQAPRSDIYGTRNMYYYNPELIESRSPKSLKRIQAIYDTVGGSEWFELALQKAR